MTSPPRTASGERTLQKFGNYYLIRKLAEGGMAEIFLAKQVGAGGFERNVVVKRMLKHLSAEEDFVHMFLDEARLAARLSHPNIVQISDLGVAEGRYFICMEYLAGEDLETVIGTLRKKEEVVPIAVAARVMLSVLEGLEFAHGYQERGQLVGIVHRDISPSNVFVTFQGTVKVVDFGIAKARTRVTATQPGTLKGKWGYMSPEQARGDVHLDGRSDLFSVGVTFHELLTGRRLFEREHELGVLLALLEQPIPLPSAARADIPPALERIVMKALERDLEARYASASAMRADLEDFLRATPSVPGVSQLAQYMQDLFGQETVQRKTKIPSLAEYGGLAALQARQEDITGLEKTLVRAPTTDSSRTKKTVAYVVPASHSSGERAASEASPPPVEAPPAARGGGLARGVLVLLALLGLGGAAAWYLLPRELLPVLPFLASSPATTVEAPPVRASPPAVPVMPEPKPVSAEAAVPVPKPVSAEAAVPEPEPASAEAAMPESESESEPALAVVAPEPRPAAPSSQPARASARLLTPKDVNAVLHKNSGSLLECGEKFRAEIPQGRRVTLRMTVRNSGDVRDPSVSEPAASTLPGLARCLEGRLARVKFPRNTNQPEMTIELPLKFNEGR
jgi:serine/threonine protein kinase